MGLQFYIGGSGAGKSEKLYQDIINQAIKEPKTRFFIIVPDQFTMQTQKALVERHPRGGIMNIDVLSFGRLSHRIFEETGGGREPVLDDTGKSLLIRKLAAERMEALPVIGKNLKKTGYIHEVKSAVSEFMQYGMGKEELAELTAYARERGSLYYKLKDLGLLYEAFEEAIQGKFVTTEGRLGQLALLLERSRLVRGSVIAFDGFTGFTPIQNRVMEKLLLLAAEVKCSILLDASEEILTEDGEQKLFYLSKKTMSRLEELAKITGVPIRTPVILNQNPVFRFRKNPGMAHLEQELFRFRNHGFEGKTEAIHLLEASSPRQEIRQVCLEIRRLLRKGNYQYRNIGVIAGDLSAYAEHVEEEFARFDIPCFVDATRSVSLNPFVEYIRSGLQIVLKNFSGEAVFHFLRSGLSGLEIEDIDRLENYVLAFGIRGKKRWSGLFTRKSGKMEGETLAAINACRQEVVDKTAVLFEPGNRVKDYVNHLYDFIVKNQIAEKLAAYEKQFKEAGDLSRAREYAQIYRRIMELLEQIVDLIGEETLSLQEFADILDAGFGEIQVGTIPQNVDRIMVGDMERTRLQEIKVLFFVGVNEGYIPRAAGSGGLLSDMDREFLQTGSFELSPTPRQQMYIQRLYLYMNMTKPSERLYLSYAKVNGEGRAVRPSYLIDTVKKLFPGITVETPEHTPEEEGLESARDGFEMLSKKLGRYAGGLEESPLFFTLYGIYAKDDACQKELAQVVEAAFCQYEKKDLSNLAARALYGTVLQNSVSRLETYAACAYAYFLKYGLSLKEREEYGFEDVDMGNIFHGVLERFSDKLTECGRTWFDFTETEGETMVEEAVEAYAAAYGETVLFSSARNTYAITRMKRILKRTVATLQTQLRKGRFVPEKFEVSFSEMEHLEAVDIALSETERMRLVGRIDRVDTCREQDKVYVKVIDYKSGNKKLDIAAVYYGLQLQLVVYLSAAMSLEQRENPGKEIVPAAILYYHMADPIVKVEGGETSFEKIRELIQKELRMTGLVNEEEAVVSLLDTEFGTQSSVVPVERKKDGSYSARSATLPEEDLRLVSAYASQKIKNIGREILMGKIKKNPYEYGQEKACTYCEYKSVCGFDLKIPGYETRKLSGMKQEEVIAQMKEAVKKEG